MRRGADVPRGQDSNRDPLHHVIRFDPPSAPHGNRTSRYDSAMTKPKRVCPIHKKELMPMSKQLPNAMQMIILKCPERACGYTTHL